MKSLKLIISNLNYFSPAWVFASINILIGTWVLYIPSVKEKLNLSDSELGLALFSFAIGVFVVIPLTPILTKKFGTGKFTKIGIVLFAVSFLFPVISPTFYWLCLSLFATGVFCGSTDIAMNALVAEIETKDSLNFMSAAHGFFSLGGVIGGGLGSLVIHLIATPFWHMIFVVIGIIATNLFLSKNYRFIVEQQHQSSGKVYDFKKLRPLLTISIIGFVIMSSEGAIEHWSSLYLKEIVEVTSKNIYGLGFVVFSFTMTIGRFFGDRISEKIGSSKLLLVGSFIAAIGYLLVLTTKFIVTILGFGIIGLGLSVIVPELYRIAGKTKGIAPSAGISFVSGISFIGFLIGPVVLGLISDKTNLKVSFMVLFVLVVIAFVISYFHMKNSTFNRNED